MEKNTKLFPAVFHQLTGEAWAKDDERADEPEMKDLAAEESSARR